MTRQERRKRRRQRRRMQAALLASLLFALVLIVTLRIRETAPEPVAERRNTLAAERQTLTYIAPARPEAAEETPEEPTVEPEPENRYAELHFSDEDVYILACLVYHEARGESFEGQVAVVEVVLNRMLSDYFPDMVIEGVNMVAGDELIIDTEHMTVTLNGENIIDRVSDDSAFFELEPGENDIIVEGGTTADVKILWKDRWL